MLSPIFAYKCLAFCFVVLIIISILPNNNLVLRDYRSKDSELEKDLKENTTRHYSRNEIIEEKTYLEENNTRHSLRNESSDLGNILEDEDSGPTLYFVESSKCKIPYVDPFDAAATAIYKPLVFESCSNDTGLVTPIYNEAIKLYVLHINETLASQILNSSNIEYNCYYQEVVRNSKMDGYDVKEAKYFSQDFVVPRHVHGLVSTCHRLGNASHILQADAFTLIQYAEPSSENQSSQDPSRRKPSIIMFGIDNLSRINLRRTMPKVYNFLTRKGWYEMQGYNKIGDNTFPNLMAILTGHSLDSAKDNICDFKIRGCMDKYPFVWNLFREAGYLTALAEDEPSLSTFNYVKPGFVEQPTDYYQRPSQKAFETLLPQWKCPECTMKYCIGRRITSSYIYDFGSEFVRRYVDERPIWGLFWTNSFSHDNYRMPSKMEDFVLQYLLDFEADGVYEQSIVIFLSDHGNRYGQLLDLPSGFLENRLPTMFIYLPPWFRAHYPEYTRALQQNQRRLTSNYDLYNTLVHLIELGNPEKSPRWPRASSCPKCHSLFEVADAERSCEDAGIPEHFCTCVPFKTVSAKWTERIAPLVIRNINGYLEDRNLTSICANLTLHYIHRTEMKIDLDKNYHEESPFVEVAVYRTKFKVKQGSADFEATVSFNNATETVEVEMPSISRVSSYEKTAKCVENKIDRLYCICLSSL